MANVKITATKNGPYKVEGAIELFYDTTSVATPGSTLSCAAAEPRAKSPSATARIRRSASRRRRRSCRKARNDLAPSRRRRAGSALAAQDLLPQLGYCLRVSASINAGPTIGGTHVVASYSPCLMTLTAVPSSTIPAVNE